MSAEQENMRLRQSLANIGGIVKNNPDEKATRTYIAAEVASALCPGEVTSGCTWEPSCPCPLCQKVKMEMQQRGLHD